MTKPLNSQLAQQTGPAPRSTSRPRTWLVALLGFGAADLLVLNLWAVPNVIIQSDTTTDMRAAQSGDVQAPSEPPLEQGPSAAVVQPKESAAENADPVEPVAEAQEAANAEAPKAEPQAEVADNPPDVPAQPPTPEEARANAAKLREALRQPPPEPEHGAEPPQPRADEPQLAAAEPPAGLSADAYAPPDPDTATPFAIRAAQRAVRFALLDRVAVSGSGPFDGLTSEDKPFSQIYFSMGNFMLGPNGKQVLERLLPRLLSDERPILIVGSADPSGSEQVNEKLSDARAQAVAEWLLIHGVDAGRIQTRAIGHEGAVGS
ncbi:MAG TPA: OmpA family protein, partial [Polyangiales bacterium]|nr:OmpA family protein [Polyangiales bacterium]